MNKKYIIENLTNEKLGIIFYILRFRPDFDYANLKEFFENNCVYIDINNIDTKYHYYSLSFTETKLNISMIGSSFQASFPLKDLRLCMEESTEEIYFKGKYDYNRDLRIPLYFKTCTYDFCDINIPLDMETFTSLMELVSDYVIKDEDEE